MSFLTSFCVCLCWSVRFSVQPLCAAHGPGTQKVLHSAAEARFMKFCSSITPTKPCHCDEQSLPCKSQNNFVTQDCKHKHEAVTTWQCDPRPQLHFYSDITRPSTLDHGRAVARTGSPHRRRDAFCARRNTGFRAIPSSPAPPSHSNSTAIYHHCLAN